MKEDFKIDEIREAKVRKAKEIIKKVCGSVDPVEVQIEPSIKLIDFVIEFKEGNNKK